MPRGRLAHMSTGEMRWQHRECGGLVVFDLSGGFCTRCHAENLEDEDCHRIAWAQNAAAGDPPETTTWIEGKDLTR